MIGELRRFGIPEYVTTYFVSKYLDKPVDALVRSNFFGDIPYIVMLNGQKEYKYDKIIQKIKSYRLEPPDRKHPNAKYRPDEIIADLDIGKCAYLKLVKKGLIIEQPADEFGKFIYYKDYDWFIRNYVPRKMVNYLPSHMNINDCAAFLGITPGKLRGAIRTHHADCVAKVRRDGKRRLRWMTKQQLIDYMDYLYNNAVHKHNVLIRKTPLCDVLSTNLCCIYMKTSVKRHKQLIATKFLVPNKSEYRYRIVNTFNKNEVDKKYDILWRKSCYGDYMPYYTRVQIRNKFGKTDLWIDTYVKDSCRTMLSKNSEPMTAEDREAYKKKTSSKVGYIGWVKEDVDKVVESGVEIEPVFEMRYASEKYLNRTDKRALQRRKIEHKKYLNRQIEYKPVQNEVELSIKAVLEQKQYEHEQHREDIKRKCKQQEAERNSIRKVLGLTEKTKLMLTPKEILLNSNIPEIVTIVYTRSGLSLYSKFSHESNDCIFYTQDSYMHVRGARKKPKFSVFNNIASVSRKIAAIPPKVTPAWIVIVRGTSYVTDTHFFDKLRNVPTEYGAVAPYGYEYFLPNGSWKKCPSTYGMYSVYSDTDSSKCRRVVGTTSCVGLHEVAMIDGPFVAIRGGYLPILQEIGHFNLLGDGSTYVPYVIGMLMKRLGIKMAQVEIDSAICADGLVNDDTLEWNKAESMLIKFGSRLATPNQ